VDDFFPIFVPYANYVKGGRTVSVRLIEGYAFVATGLAETKYFSLERSVLVAKVFSTSVNGLRVLHTLPNERVREMRSRLVESMSADLELGSKVRITGGNYRDLVGTVIDLYDKKVAVKVEFRSLTSITVIPRNLAVFASEEDQDGGQIFESETLSLDELVARGEVLI